MTGSIQSEFNEMMSIQHFRWITLHDYLGMTPFELPEETLFQNPNLTDRPQYEVGAKVRIRQRGLHYLIEKKKEEEEEKEKEKEEEEESTGMIVCKRLITQEDLERFRRQEEKSFKPSFKPTLDRIFEILSTMYLGRTVYCVHMDDLEEDGSDLFFTLPWSCLDHFNGNICSEHGTEDLKYFHYTCHRLAI